MSDLAVLMPGFAGPALPRWIEGALQDGLAGVCLFGSNVESPDQLRGLTDAIYAANARAVIAIDEEGGDVTRLYRNEGSPFPGNAVLGRLADVSATSRVAEQVGWELRLAGVGLALAPDVDVNSNPDNPVIGVRSFGANPDLVSAHAAAWVHGLQSTGVAASAKHFPGHGDTSLDSHLSLPVVGASEAELRARELPPFQAAIAAGVATVMSSHILVPALDASAPATFSPRILRGLLREELGFDGVVVSDALDMVGASGTLGEGEAATRALAAGCDLLCLGSVTTEPGFEQIRDALGEATADGRLRPERLADAAVRVAQLGDTLRRSRERLSIPAEVQAGVVPGVDAARVAEAFRVSDRARNLLSLRASRGAPLTWVKLDPDANIAVGATPWGPFAAGIEPGAVIDPDRQAPAVRPDGALVIVVGKDNHRFEWARTAIDALRSRGDVIAVDMGWPDPDYAYADIATFGASRLVGTALLRLIG